ncbi:MAG: very short patch repair endonuclease [Candidatus Omnitrophica bacterium]|nr:very short patch repair endonuclease [Candidatus Omnitrophota bacterium]
MAYKFVTSKQRSELMSRIRSNNTKPELLLRKKLWGQGLRFNRKTSKLPGKPDIVLDKHRIVIFIDGEFWHGYQWKQKKKKIKDNRGYWIPKIEKTIARDRKNNRNLRKSGWQVIRFWQQQVIKYLPKCIQKIKKSLR